MQHECKRGEYRKRLIVTPQHIADLQALASTGDETAQRWLAIVIAYEPIQIEAE